MRGTQPRMDAPAVRVYTLGGFRVVVGEHVLEDSAWRRRTARQLFKVLLTRPGRRMSRDEVIELFWPESDADAAASNLRSTVYAMRHALDSAAEVVAGDHASLWLESDATLWTDAADFEQRVAEAWRSADPLPLLEQASVLYAGEYLPDDLFEDWASERRESLKRTWTELQFGLAQALEARSDVNAALQPLERLLRTDPCDERAAQEQMKLLTRHGRRAEALRVYQRLVRSLREELDVDPSAETLELHRQISTGEAVANPPARVTAFRCTYPFPAPAELIGREAELSTLEQVLVGGRTGGRVALVAAPAGTGKSALLGQIVRLAQAQGVLCLAGGCYEERGAVPLGPFHDALVDYLLAQPADSLEESLGASVDDLATVVPELRYHLRRSADRGASHSATMDRMRAFGAIHAFLRMLAERGPLLVCLEDLHASDEATLQLLHYLARQTRRVPLVLLATYRSDEAAPDQPLAQSVAAMRREGLARHVRLEALDRSASDRLVAKLLDGRPSPSLGESLFETTGGNPLFVEQLVLALGEAGQLERRAGIWHSAGDLRGTPQIVREVIAQRLQRLDARCREMLAMGSVLGQSFEHSVLLAALSPVDETTLLADADRAINTQVLQETSGGYAFRHALLREAVYWDLTRPKRMLLHGRAAELLEGLHGEHADDFAAELAYHYGLAGDSAASVSKALHYSLEAGRRAAALSSYPEALQQFNAAWAHLARCSPSTDPELPAEVMRGRGWAEMQLGRWPETVATYEAVLMISSTPVARARCYGLIAFAYTHMGDLPRVVEKCHSGLAELDGTTGADAANARLQLQQVLGMTLHWQGRYYQLLQLGSEMRAQAAELKQPRAEMLANAVSGWGHWGLGQIQQSLDHLQIAADASEQLGEKQQMAASYENMGLVEYAGGRFADAREHLGRALTLHRESASELRAANARQTLCRVWLAEGEHDIARQRLEEALAIELAGQERWAADAYTVLGMIKALHAQWDEAEASFTRAIEMRRQAGHRAGEVEATVGLGLVFQHTGRWPEAFEAYTRAVEVSEEMDPSPAHVIARRHRGRLALLCGDMGPASADIEGSFELAESIPESLEYGPALLTLAELRHAQGRLEDAIDQATRSVTRCRALQNVVEANVVLANVSLARHDSGLADKAAVQAVEQASTLDSPRLLSMGYVARARVAAVNGSKQANRTFEMAIRYAEQAGAPFERAAAQAAYAWHLRSSNIHSQLVDSMEIEAQTVLGQLQASARAARSKLSGANAAIGYG